MVMRCASLACTVQYSSVHEHTRKVSEAGDNYREANPRDHASGRGEA
jgi:hypothetical protein